jgi:hypothetical protein
MSRRSRVITRPDTSGWVMPVIRVGRECAPVPPRRTGEHNLPPDPAWEGWSRRKHDRLAFLEDEAWRAGGDDFLGSLRFADLHRLRRLADHLGIAPPRPPAEERRTPQASATQPHRASGMGLEHPPRQATPPPTTRENSLWHGVASPGPLDCCAAGGARRGAAGPRRAGEAFYSGRAGRTGGPGQTLLCLRPVQSASG